MWYFVLGIVVAWLVFNSLVKKHGNVDGIIVNNRREIDDEQIEERKERFEDFSINKEYIPTSLGGQDRALYFLMRDWFVILDEKFTHDKEAQQRIRQDWLSYMHYVDGAATSKYLWLESEDEESGESYYQEGRNQTLRSREIENRFAEILGDDAKQALEGIRNRESHEWLEEDMQRREVERKLRKEKEEKLAGSDDAVKKQKVDK